MVEKEVKVKLSELMYQVAFALDCVEKDLLKVSTNHTKRVAYLCILTGKYLGMDEVAALDLACAGILHDNALTEYILSERADAYDEKVWKTNMEKHCILGEENGKAFPFAGDTRGYILYHHENADGTGPFRKKEGEIPLGAEIIHICDRVDTIYALGKYTEEKYEKICAHVESGKGSLYPERVAGAFLHEVTDQVFQKMQDDRIDQSLKEITPAKEREVPVEALIDFCTVVSRIVDYKSHFTREHSYQIAQKARRMSEYYGYPEAEAKQFYVAAALHDLGKLATPVSILEKPGALTEEEFEIMKKHVYYTWQMLNRVKGMEQITIWASSHHEKLDGTGYPFGKKAEELDDNCRLLTCIDIYQALSEDRPYRKGMTHQQAMKILYQMVDQGAVDKKIVKDMDRVFG